MVVTDTVSSETDRLDARPIRRVSGETLWDDAIAARDAFATEIRKTLRRHGTNALVYVSQKGNYPPWVRLEIWLPVEDGNPARQRAELELLADVKPFHTHQFVYTARLKRGMDEMVAAERIIFSPKHVLEWTEAALGLRYRPSSYTPILDGIRSVFGMIFPAIKPHHNPVADEFRPPWLTPGTIVLVVGAVLLTEGLSAWPENLGQGVTLSIIGIMFIAMAVIASVLRKKIVAVPTQPTVAPREPLMVDTWNTVVLGLGLDGDAIKRRLTAKLGDVCQAGAECAPEVYNYRTPNGYEEREQLVISKAQSLVYVHVYRFGNDLYVGWQAHLNCAAWSETKPVSTVAGDGLEIEYRELRPGYYSPQEFDLIDLNGLAGC